MELTLFRPADDEDWTFGLLFDDSGTREFLCETLEDGFREEKIHGKTRIPPGRRKLALRCEGGMHERYKKRFGAWHRGMLWIQGVENFSWVYLHIGNDEDDTEGCPLVGESNSQQRASGFLGNSTATYRRIYDRIASAIEAGDAYITIIDPPRKETS